RAAPTIYHVRTHNNALTEVDGKAARNTEKQHCDFCFFSNVSLNQVLWQQARGCPHFLFRNGAKILGKGVAPNWCKKFMAFEFRMDPFPALIPSISPPISALVSFYKSYPLFFVKGGTRFWGEKLREKVRKQRKNQSFTL
ncbi:hypothetical protein AABB24_021681, partial [Solanum stoloniferum]